MTWRNRNHTLVHGRLRERSDRVDQVAAAAFVTESGHVPKRGNSVLNGLAAVSAADVWEGRSRYGGRADHRAYPGTVSSIVSLTLMKRPSI
jgi:hypothetical protein